MSTRNRQNTVPEALLQVDNRTAQSLLIQQIIIFVFDNYRCKHVETKNRRVLEICHPDFVVDNSSTAGEKFELKQTTSSRYAAGAEAIT